MERGLVQGGLRYGACVFVLTLNIYGFFAEGFRKLANTGTELFAEERRLALPVQTLRGNYYDRWIEEGVCFASFSQCSWLPCYFYR